MAFKCEQCPETFGLHKHLKRHIEAKHTDVKFQCNVCQFSTNRSDNLKRHKMSKHTESTVNNHNEVDKILKCPHCDISASTQSNLKSHIRLKHSSDKKFICEECGEIFPRYDYYLRHQALHKRKTQEDIAPKPKRVKGRINVDVDENVPLDGENVENAFNELFTSKRWLVRGLKDPLSTLKEYEPRVQNWIMRILEKSTLKYYITMKIEMVKSDKEGNNQTHIGGFSGGMQTVLRASQFKETYQNSKNKIAQSFDEFLKNGSGWILK